MSYSCKILLDSISETGKRLTTMEVTFPRIVLAEWNTHRMFSRNSASSRAIPFSKMLERVIQNPFIPERFPINERGMQPKEYVSLESDEILYNHLAAYWLEARVKAIVQAQKLLGAIGDAEPILENPAKYVGENNLYKQIHKQLINRLLEPFQWHTVIVTATEFSNFFKLRCDENAQYEIRRIADLMYEAYHAWDNSSEFTISKGWENERGIREWEAIKPQKLKVGEWHCPLVNEEDEELIDDFIPTHIGLLDNLIDGFSCLASQEQYLQIEKRISVARCARVSYLTHDGKRDIEKDLELFERLRTSGHWSPFEHVATPLPKTIASRHSTHQEWAEEIEQRSGNFIGWKQYRKEFQDENCTNFRKEN